MSIISFSADAFGLSALEDTIMTQEIYNNFTAKFIEGNRVYPLGSALQYFDQELKEYVVAIRCEVGWTEARSGVKVRDCEDVAIIRAADLKDYTWDDQELVLRHNIL